MSGVGQNVRDFAEENTYVQRSAKKFFCFAKHDPGNARQKFTQPGKRNLADICNCIGALATSEGKAVPLQARTGLCFPRVHKLAFPRLSGPVYRRYHSLACSLRYLLPLPTRLAGVAGPFGVARGKYRKAGVRK